MRYTSPLKAVLAVPLLTGVVAADKGLPIDSVANIRSTAKIIADDLLSFYKANQTAGIPGIVESYFPEGGYWWGPAGGMWQVLIDYWHYTGDASYNDMIMQALLWQRGKYNDFVPDNWTTAVSNDDQGFWATAAMVAAERGFPDPPAKDNLTWISMVETVFNEYVGRYDETSCGGGMRWQILTLNFGYFEKTSLANGFLFSLSARLARYTGNKTYADWADKTWDWAEKIGLIDRDYAVYKGAAVMQDCRFINKHQWTSSNAIFVLGASYMYNYTNGDAKWRNRTSKLIEHGIKTFFPNETINEVSCQEDMKCTGHKNFYKGLLHQWWTVSTSVAPFLSESVLPVLKKSVAAAAKECNRERSPDTRICGASWIVGYFRNNTGGGEEMSVLAAVSGLLVGEVAAPRTAKAANSSVAGGNGGGDKGGNKGGKGSMAAKLDGGVFGVMFVSIGTMLLSVLAL